MKSILFISMFFLSFSYFAQESHGDRTIDYKIDLDLLKYETQAQNIEKELKILKGVKHCNVDALNYLLHVTVFEPQEGDKSIGIDAIKIVLANNKVDIKNYTQKITNE